MRICPGCAPLPPECRSPIHPGFPGPWGGFVSNNLRELLTTLDVYLAILLSLTGVAYRWLSRAPDPAAFPILAVLAVLAMSTFAQSLFGMDFESAMTRYRLLPLRGWQILAAKDVAFLLVLIVVVLPLDIWTGLAEGVTALAIGHHSSVFLRLPHQRWRFTGGRLLPAGAVQGLACVAAGAGTAEKGLPVLGAAVTFFAVSLFWYGRCWDRRTRA